mgnify:CR=1 FL=1
MKKKLLAVALSVAVSGSMMFPGLASAAPKTKVPAKGHKQVHAKLKNAKLKEGELKKGFEVKEVAKIEDSNRLAIKGFDTFSQKPEVKAYSQAITSSGKVIVNGTEYVSGASGENEWTISSMKEWLSIGPAAFTEGENSVVIKAEGYEDKTVKFNKSGDDFTFVSQSDGSAPNPNPNPNPNTGIEDPKENGDYTLSFKATDMNTGEPMPMVQNALDKNVKLKVENGKMKISILNTKLAEDMLDMTIGLGDKFEISERKPFGKPSVTGKYDAYEYTMPIEKIGEKHTIGVLVTAMPGGVPGNVHKWDKYKKAYITFDTIKKGWTGYESVMTADEALTKALVKKGYDTNHDNSISDEELKAIEGELNLENCKLTDISRLSELSDKVTKLNLSNNKIEKLPDNLLKNLTKLEMFVIEGNLIEEIPKDFFENNKDLKWLNMSSNMIKKVSKEDFKGLSKVWNFDLGGNKISKVDADLLENMTSVKEFSLGSNELKSIPDDLLKPVANTLTFINFNYNKLNRLPKAVQKATKLENIQAHSNNITDISGIDFSKLAALKELQLMKNSITKLPEKVFAGNRNLYSVDLHDNNLKSVSPDVLPRGSNMHKFDLSMNDIVVLDPALAKKIKAWNKLYPQKSVIKFKLTADGSKNLKWNQKFDLLNLRYWYDETVSDYKKEITSISEYQEMFNKKNSGKSIVDVLKAEKRQWNITTTIQKKNSDGTFKTISEKKVSNVADMMSGSYKSEGKGTYRVIKRLDISINGSLSRGAEVVSNEAVVGNKVVPAAPTRLKAKSAGYDRITLSWNKVKGASSYAVYKQSGKKFVKVKTVSKNSCVITGLKTGTKYSFKVAAIAKGVYGKQSAVASAKPMLSAVKGLKVKRATKRSAKLQWKKVRGAKGYKIYRATGKKGKFKLIKTLKGNKVKFINKKLKKGKKYAFKVKAYRVVSKKVVLGPFSIYKLIKIKR